MLLLILAIKMKKDKLNKLLIIIGIALILVISIFQGFYESFATMTSHLIKDFTIELIEHLYIAGFVLVIVGILGLKKRA